MKTSRVLWVVAGIIILAGVFVLIRGMPTDLPKLFGVDEASYNSRLVHDALQQLESSDKDVRLQAIHSIGKLGSDGADAVPALARILRESSIAQERNEAALALSKMAPASGGAVPALAEALEDQDYLVRMNSANALAELGPYCKPAVPALKKALKDKTNHTNVKRFIHTIHQQLALALGRATAGTSDGVAALVEALEAARDDKEKFDDQGQAMVHANTVYQTEVTIARALGEVGPEARSAVPLLRAMLQQDKSPMTDFRAAAREALKKIEGK